MITVFFCVTSVLTGIARATRDYNLNYEKWNALNINDYSVTVRDGTLTALYSKQHEVVRSGKLVSSPDASGRPSIDRLFEYAKECASNPIAYWCSIDYDTQYGYPHRYAEQDLDMGEVTEISDLEILPTQAP